MLCFRAELTGGECADDFSEAAIGADGSFLDKSDAKRRAAFELLYDSQERCGFAAADSYVKVLAAGRCKPIQYFAQCKDDRYTEWLAGMEATDFNGDGNISAKEHFRSENKHILELMSQKVNETALSKLQQLNTGQVQGSFASEETQDAQ